VGDENASYAPLLIVQVTGIGYHQVNAKHLLIGKHQSRINNYDVVPIFDDHHILPDFSQPS
jgi:hypothetical protein